MAWKQTRSFNIGKMGKRAGWCLMNCRLGFGINVGTYPSAKADMEAQKKNGTFHTDPVPTNVAVPVYCDTSSRYEHVVVSDHGTVYSDGKKVIGGLSAFKVFGWGECCDGARVVSWAKDPAPAPTPSTGFLPARGYWTQGDRDWRIGNMASWMRQTFPAYTPKAALGNLFGPYLTGAVKQFQKRTGLVADGSVGPKTYAMMKKYGFKG